MNRILRLSLVTLGLIVALCNPRRFLKSKKVQKTMMQALMYVVKTMSVVVKQKSFYIKKRRTLLFKFLNLMI